MNATGDRQRERIDCPLCGADEPVAWASENGYTAVRCGACGLIYVNPRPAMQTIDQAVRSGVHTSEVGTLDTKTRPLARNHGHYMRVVRDLFADTLARGEAIRWLDVGAGYGEVVGAVAAVAPPGSRIEGIEPMKHKVDWAREHGLNLREGYLSDVTQTYDVVSVINVFSHIPDFAAFLQDVKRLLSPLGELLLETGNVADVGDRTEFPDVLNLPDHLVFAGESHIQRFLKEAGFEIVATRRFRMDHLRQFSKNIVKWLLRRPVWMRWPYTSPMRSVIYRARRVD